VRPGKIDTDPVLEKGKKTGTLIVKVTENTRVKTGGAEAAVDHLHQRQRKAKRRTGTRVQGRGKARVKTAIEKQKLF